MWQIWANVSHEADSTTNIGNLSDRCWVFVPLASVAREKDKKEHCDSIVKHVRSIISLNLSLKLPLNLILRRSQSKGHRPGSNGRQGLLFQR
jgi:hypothetical protein